MIVFADANISPRLIELMARSEFRKQKHDYRDIASAPFSRDMPDEEWIPLLSQQADPEHSTIVAFSGDAHILDSKIQRQLLKQGGFNYILATDKFIHLQWPEQAWRYLRAWIHLQREIKQRNDPAVYKIYPGRAKPVFSCYIKDL